MTAPTSMLQDRPPQRRFLFEGGRRASRPGYGDPGRLRLLEAVPEFQLAVPPDERALVARALVVPAVSVPAGPLPPLASSAAAPYAVVVAGTVLKITTLGHRPATEILGEGDVLDLHAEDEPPSLPVAVRHESHQEATVAMLDERFWRAAARWPGLHETLRTRLAQQCRRASTHLAILQQPRVEDRVLAVFVELADRRGKVTGSGIRIDLQLTHELIGRLVGGRRPTVTLALAQLARTGALIRLPDGAWLLSHQLLEGAAA